MMVNIVIVIVIIVISSILIYNHYRGGVNLYICNKNTGECVISKNGVSKSSCQKTCIKPIVYKCNTDTGSCEVTQGEGKSQGLCESDCKILYKTIPGENCVSSDNTRECDFECSTLGGCKDFNKDCCFSEQHEGKNGVSWCFNGPCPKKSPKTLAYISYLKSVYPTTKERWDNFDAGKIEQLINRLNLYYVPIVDKSLVTNTQVNLSGTSCSLYSAHGSDRCNARLFDGSRCDCLRAWYLPECACSNSDKHNKCQTGNVTNISGCPQWDGLLYVFNQNDLEQFAKQKGLPSNVYYEGLTYPGEYGGGAYKWTDGKVYSPCRENFKLQYNCCDGTVTQLPTKNNLWGGQVIWTYFSPGLGQWFSTGKKAVYCGTKLGFCVKEGNYKLQTIIDNATKIMTTYGDKLADWAILKYQIQELAYKHNLTSEQAHELAVQIYIYSISGVPDDVLNKIDNTGSLTNSYTGVKDYKEILGNNNFSNNSPDVAWFLGVGADVLFTHIMAKNGITTLQCVEPQSPGTSNRPFAIEIAVMPDKPDWSLCKTMMAASPIDDLDNYINYGYIKPNTTLVPYKNIVSQGTPVGNTTNEGKYITI